MKAIGQTYFVDGSQIGECSRSDGSCPRGNCDISTVFSRPLDEPCFGLVVEDVFIGCEIRVVTLNDDSLQIEAVLKWAESKALNAGRNGGPLEI